MTSPSSSRYFRPAAPMNREGLVAIGGHLSPDWLLDAYTHGIFPWPFRDNVLAWWSPDPRAIIELDGLHVSRRLRRTCRSGKFEVSVDRDFEGVIRGCATAQDRTGRTWITPPLVAAYCRMHQLGYCHSVEVWREGRLAGGVYGLAIGGLFAAESMFHYVTDASKVAVVNLVENLRHWNFQLLDIQQRTPHSASLGAIDISRADYLRRLSTALKAPCAFGASIAQPINE